MRGKQLSSGAGTSLLSLSAERHYGVRAVTLRAISKAWSKLQAEAHRQAWITAGAKIESQRRLS